jgi:chorismate dehydratase
MAEYRLGCVPYLNARPLIAPLEGDPEFTILYEPPSSLPALIESGEVHAAMVSSIFALQTPSARVAAGVSISSRGRVESVRLFSQVPFDGIRTLALDKSSLTSNALCRLILAERYGCEPTTLNLAPDLELMLSSADAALLIGDPGMSATPPEELFVLDLGKAWEDMTGLPFVWALWVGGDGLDDRLAARLVEARSEGVASIEVIAKREADTRGWSLATCRHYLAEVMEYTLNNEHLEAMRRFGEMCARRGLLESVYEPELVGALMAG